MKKILIANRGEIACRIIRSCRNMGLETVAVYSEADNKALHVQQSDEAVLIGPAQAVKSYLDAERIIAAAHETGAIAVHPGYGFLSESADFADAVEQAGLAWIGPRSKTIRDMGDKETARKIASAAGVPVLPASDAFDGGDVGSLVEAATKIGYPVLVKAAGGGGGIGMKIVENEKNLAAAIESTHAQAKRSFGVGKLYLEKFLPHARHIEVQVFGTGDGRVSSFFDRDCSVQRRFQKVIEEAPAAGISEETRHAMSNAAVALAVKAEYRSAGTVEFVVDADTDDFYFLEMNTRIQVEHGVTEMILGIDLIDRQLVLMLEGPDDKLLDVPAPTGAAIEARIYSENPLKRFLPQPGTLQELHLPFDMEGIRVDSGVCEGDTISPYYDPMIAKIIAVGRDRMGAIARLHEALAATRIVGLSTNLGFLQNVLSHTDFQNGAVCTSFVEMNFDELVAGVAAAQ